MRAVLCALQLGRMLLGRQHGAVCLERFTSQGLLVKRRKNRNIYHGSFVMWGGGGVANVCIALHMWCAEHCTCGALHVAHVQIIALYVFARCSSARVLGGRLVLRPAGGGARDGGFLWRRCADACVAHATTRWAAMGAAAEKANAPPSRRGGRGGVISGEGNSFC